MQINIKYTIILVCLSDGFGELVAAGSLEGGKVVFERLKALSMNEKECLKVSHLLHYIVQSGS